jgi:hypothetical protein
VGQEWNYLDETMTKGNGDLRKRSLDLMKKKDNLEGIMMNSRDFLRR